MTNSSWSWQNHGSIEN